MGFAIRCLLHPLDGGAAGASEVRSAGEMTLSLRMEYQTNLGDQLIDEHKPTQGRAIASSFDRKDLHVICEPPRGGANAH